MECRATAHPPRPRRLSVCLSACLCGASRIHHTFARARSSEGPRTRHTHTLTRHTSPRVSSRNVRGGRTTHTEGHPLARPAPPPRPREPSPGKPDPAHSDASYALHHASSILHAGPACGVGRALGLGLGATPKKTHTHTHTHTRSIFASHRHLSSLSLPSPFLFAADAHAHAGT
ncbi:hypothetical protein BC628DRAFT_270200 [Trametes gibbosa]|nr:hypothetical protein BC628DRAFT_270200 [Trametes gibbosa]